MTKCAPGWRLFPFFVLMVGLLAGCSQFKRAGVDDERDPHYLEGQRRAKGYDWDGAIESYERALQSNPNNAEAHRELGHLYYEKKNDYAAAIYHYQRHLKLKPGSSMADQIKLQIEYSYREIAKSHSIVPVDREIQAHFERMSMTNKLLQNRIDFLEAQLAKGPQYITKYVTNFYESPNFPENSSRILTRPATIVEPPQQGGSAQSVAESEVVAEPEPPARRPSPQQQVARQEQPRRQEPRRDTERVANNNRREPPAEKKVRTHTVRPGETMAVLAKKYGVSVSALKAANPGTSRGVRAKQVIKIPAK